MERRLVTVGEMVLLNVASSTKVVNPVHRESLPRVFFDEGKTRSDAITGGLSPSPLSQPAARRTRRTRNRVNEFGEEAGTPVTRNLSVPIAGAPATLSVTVRDPWLRQMSRSVMGVAERVVLTIGGHLRRSPDSATEISLRSALAELDGELAAILGDRAAAG